MKMLCVSKWQPSVIRKQVAEQVECASFSSDEDALDYNIDIEWLTDSILKQYIVLLYSISCSLSIINFIKE
jgi:hypothetical protein